MESMEENIAPTTTIFDLPLTDLLIHLAKGLEIQDIFSLRCCSRYFKELGDEMLEDLKELVLKDRCNEMTFHVITQKCHKLRKITLNWTTVVRLTDEELAELLSNNPHLEEVDLTLSRNITLKGLSPLATSCKKLVKLSIAGLLCDDGFLEMLSERNNQLLEIHFFLSWRYLVIPMGTFEQFFKKQPHLQRISLWFIGFYLTIVLSTIAEACKDLNYLGLPAFSSLRRSRANGFEGYEDELRTFVKSCPKLHTLKFSGDPCVNVTQVTHEFWQFLQSKNIGVEGTKLLPLHSLDISDSENEFEIFDDSEYGDYDDDYYYDYNDDDDDDDDN